MYDIQPIVEKVIERIESHKLGEGRYARWLWQDDKGSRDLGVNPYGCADAANLYYMLGYFPKDLEKRAEWVKTMQSMQDPATGLFCEATHHPYHTTAHVTAALELFDADALYRPTELLYTLEKGEIEKFLHALDWNDPWPMSHRGAGIYVIMNLMGEARREWNDDYFRWFWDNADPETGFWRNGDFQREGHAPIWHYMAGGFHFLFNHESAHMPVRYPEKIIDSCIKMYRESKPKSFGKIANFLEIDWIYCLSRCTEQTHYRYDEVRSVLWEFTKEYMDFWNTVKWESEGSVNDLHMLFGGICAIAELQRIFRGEIRSDRPLKLVLDRRPFI